jgi:hypothetical protein
MELVIENRSEKWNNIGGNSQETPLHPQTRPHEITAHSFSRYRDMVFRLDKRFEPNPSDLSLRVLFTCERAQVDLGSKRIQGKTHVLRSWAYILDFQKA